MPNCFVIFFNDTATTEIYALSLHDALPISLSTSLTVKPVSMAVAAAFSVYDRALPVVGSAEESLEVESHRVLVCRVLFVETSLTTNEAVRVAVLGLALPLT